VRWVSVSGKIDRAATPDRSQLIGVVADVTDKREAAERLRVLRNEFAHLARVNDLGEMAAAIAHEINQPLTAISNYLNAGLQTACDQPQAMMQRAAEQALRAGQIVRRLREFIGNPSNGGAAFRFTRHASSQAIRPEEVSEDTGPPLL